MSNCDLCGTAVADRAIQDSLKNFCCYGCQAVFKVLASRGELINFQDNPLFRQAVAHGLISNPDLLKEIEIRERESQKERHRLHFEISDMWCPSCAEVISWILIQKAGVLCCLVDYASDLSYIEYSPFEISKEEVFEAIRDLGYHPIPLGEQNKNTERPLYIRLGIASFCAFNSMMLASPLYATYFHGDFLKQGSLFAWLSFFFTLPVITYCSWPLFLRAWTGLKVGICGMELLVTLGAVTAFTLSTFQLAQGETNVYFDSLGVIVAFVLLGKAIEKKAKFSAKTSLLRLFRSLPKKGRKLGAEGSYSYVPIKEISRGDQIVVLAGEKVILDGEVVDGEGTCDESLMTGEAVPIVKRRGDKVVGGALLQQGSLTVRVLAGFEESILQKIISSIQQEIGYKAVYLRAADRVISWFVPVVVGVALFTAFYCWFWEISEPGKSVFYTAWMRAASVLLISCPCAIGISAPLAESYVMQGLANLGVIVRNRGCLALLGKETVWVFDKTGTLTTGTFKLIRGLEQLSPVEQAALKGLAMSSIHPLSRALVKALEKVKPLKFEKIEQFVGQGIEGICKTKAYFLGSDEFLRERGFSIPQDEEKEAVVTPVYFGFDSLFVQLLLGDEIRLDALELSAQLKNQKTILLSGDAPAVVKNVAERCGLDQWQARVSPFEKRAYIESLRKEGHLVCMVGDGINDAPALTAAHVGISMLAAAEISIQVSDLLLTTDRLYPLVAMRELACKGRKIVSQNLFWAFFYNVMGIGLAAAGMLTPLYAAVAMVVSSLIVVGNAWRAKRV